MCVQDVFAKLEDISVTPHLIPRLVIRFHFAGQFDRGMVLYRV